MVDRWKRPRWWMDGRGLGGGWMEEVSVVDGWKRSRWWMDGKCSIKNGQCLEYEVLKARVLFLKLHIFKQRRIRPVVKR